MTDTTSRWKLGAHNMAPLLIAGVLAIAGAMLANDGFIRQRVLDHMTQSTEAPTSAAGFDQALEDAAHIAATVDMRNEAFGLAALCILGSFALVAYAFRRRGNGRPRRANPLAGA
ncbi:MAG: hypothetical protein AAF411_13245 [Myxococcota bacterium]